MGVYGVDGYCFDTHSTESDKMNICDNISVKEVVCPDMYKKYGDNAIRFIDKDLIAVLDVIRNKI